MLPPTPSDRTVTADAASDPTVPPAGARCAVHGERLAHSVCARCGSFACTTCLHVLASGEALCAACEEKAPGTLAWEQRRQIGIGPAIARTIAGALLRPHAFFAQRPRERALWPTLMLGMTMHVVGQVGASIWDLVFAEQTRAELRADPFGRQLMWLASDEFFVGQIVLAPLLFFVTTLLSASLWWIGLRAVGGLKRPFHVIVRALSYSQATALVVPFVAPLAFLGPAGAGIAMAFSFWATAIQVIAVSRMQGIEVGRGLLAMMVWVAIVGCVVFVGGGALLWGVASQIRIPGGL